jgi:ParB family transcriptional regulator, chromosome partitioning protein
MSALAKSVEAFPAALASLSVPLSQLTVSDCNVRTYKTKDVESMIASIRSKGLLQTLLVRPRTEGKKGYEVIAGQRRYNALSAIAKADKIDPAIPCLQLADDTDAAAIEASLEENTQRADMDAIDRFDAIAALIKAGKSETEAADDLGMTPASIKKHLALAKLTPAIKKLYRNDALDDRDLYTLTLATRAKQQEYASLVGTKNQPASYRLREWITGSHRDLLVKHAKFPLEAYTGAIITDLFGDTEETAFFGDSEQFWKLQREAVTGLRQSMIDSGWTTVKIWDTDTHYRPYEYKPCKKSAGGEVHIIIEQDGKITVHSGRGPVHVATSARGGAAPDEGREAVQDAPDRPELTASQSRYVDAIRYAAVRAALADNPTKGVRWLIAHLIGGHAEHLNATRAYPRCDEAEELAAIEQLPTTQTFDKAVNECAILLGLPNTEHIVGNLSGSRDTALLEIYSHLCTQSDSDILYIATLIMAETLAVGSKAVDLIGKDLNVAPDIDAKAAGPLVTTLRGSDMLTAVLAEVGAKSLATQNATATTTLKKQLIEASLAKAKKPWAAKWLQFPQQAYTDKPVTATTRSGA